MSFLDKKSGRGELILTAAGVMAILLFGIAVANGIADTTLSRFEAPTFELESELKKMEKTEPEITQGFKVIRENYPEDYDIFVNRINEMVRSGSPENKVKEEIFALVQNFMASKRADLASAPAEDVRKVIVKNIEFFRHLSVTSEEQCAQISIEGYQPGTRLSPTTRRIMAQAGVAAIEAAAAGRDGARAPVGASTSQDWEAVLVAMKNNGVSESGIEYFLNGTYATLDNGERCALGVAFYESIADIPPDSAQRILVEMLTEPVA